MIFHSKATENCLVFLLSILSPGEGFSLVQNENKIMEVSINSCRNTQETRHYRLVLFSRTNQDKEHSYRPLNECLKRCMNAPAELETKIDFKFPIVYA